MDVKILALARRAKGRTSEVKGIEATVKAARVHVEELVMIGRVGKFETITAVAAAAAATAAAIAAAAAKAKAVKEVDITILARITTHGARAAMHVKGDTIKKMKIMIIILIAEKVAATEAAAAALHMHVTRV